MFAVRYTDWRRGGEIVRVYESKSEAQYATNKLRGLGYPAYVEEDPLAFDTDSQRQWDYYNGNDSAVRNFFHAAE
jgi:hypothetical protein